jgi:hypothetical protein
MAITVESWRVSKNNDRNIWHRRVIVGGGGGGGGANRDMASCVSNAQAVCDACSEGFIWQHFYTAHNDTRLVQR